MDFYKPSPIKRPVPVCPTKGTKTDSAALSSTSSTIRTLSTNPQPAIHSTMARSQTSTSQWATGFTKKPSESASTTMGPSRGITVLRGPTSNPILSTYTWHLTIALTPPLKHFQHGSDTCSLVLVGTSKFYNKRWPILTIGAWPARSRTMVSLTTTSWRSQLKSSSTNAISTPSEHGLHHVSPASCLPGVPNEWPLQNVLRKLRAVRLGWKRGSHALCGIHICTMPLEDE
jgi:hypothetical protein